MGAHPAPHVCAYLEKGQECQCARLPNEEEVALDLAGLPEDSPPPYDVAIRGEPLTLHGAESHVSDEKKPSGLIHDPSGGIERGESSWRLETPALPPRLRDVTHILSKPIAIPTVRSAQGSPYLRAYPLELASLGITRETFLSFLDHVNRVTVDSPPIVAVGMVGGVLGLVPEPTTALAGTIIDLAANTTNAALSQGRTELVLRSANNKIFHPVGLKVSIAKLEAVAKIAGMPFLDPETGKLTSGLRVLAPLDEERELHTLSAQHRRLRDLEQWLSPLDLEELPEVETPSSLMGKMHVKMSEFQRKEEEKELLKSRQKSLEKYTEGKQKAQERYEKAMRQLDRRVEKAGMRAGKDERKPSVQKEREEEENHEESQTRENERGKGGEDVKEESRQTEGSSSKGQYGLDEVVADEDTTDKGAKREEKEKRRLEKQQKKAEKEEKKGEEKDHKEKKRTEDRKLKEAERENRRREEKEREREKEARRAEKRAEKVLTKMEEKRAAVRGEYEKELKKRSDEYEKNDKEQRGIKKINWLIITERNRLEGSVGMESELNPNRIAERCESRQQEDLKRNV